KHFPKESQGYAANEARIIAYNIAINTLQQLDEPQAEKVEVPDYVAEWYEVNKGNLEFNIASAFHRIGRNTHNPQHSIYEWLNDSNNEPMQTLFKMKDGYTVKPKRWVVVNKKGRYFMHFNSDAEHPFEKVFGFDASDGYPFTNRAKAEAVATLVDGSVEEV
ncbi:DUF1642 domain-containing protein, partial [Enterococcus dispar]